MIKRTDPSPEGGPNTETSAPVPADARTPDEGAPRFRPHLRSFAGPLDLLLYLIQKNEVDIFDIPIADVLEQYLQHVEVLERNGLLDLLDAGEFLVMASRLMEIKSRMLLPDMDAADDELLEEELEDPRLSLVEQLLEYREIKERAVLLEESHAQWSRRYDHPADDLPELEHTLDLTESTTWDLCAAFDRVVAEARRDDTKVIPFDDTPVEVIIQGIQERLEAAAEGSLRFRELFTPEMGLAYLISHFLALLEMARMQMVYVTQEAEFGEIVLTRRLLA